MHLCIQQFQINRRPVRIGVQHFALKIIQIKHQPVCGILKIQQLCADLFCRNRWGTDRKAADHLILRPVGKAQLQDFFGCTGLHRLHRLRQRIQKGKQLTATVLRIICLRSDFLTV